MFRTSKLVVSLIVVFVLVASLVSAQEAATVTKGRRLFNAYCSGCHSIGGGVIVGPDLKAVTERRTVGWLVDFISSPARMLREKDRTAVDLVSRFDGYLMPSLGLSKANIEDVIAYLKSVAPNR